ncbi:hypothetical protein CEXT_643071 [Caerostris extrusa]|uniref:Secreted protein n=1 Tax=Caerostris extrusa TaxID=172846 RepID=A0AAV4XN24_CAEEX|nr:hypothetical protein CEXT_643071 [Caerostris extrusa]
MEQRINVLEGVFCVLFSVYVPIGCFASAYDGEVEAFTHCPTQLQSRSKSPKFSLFEWPSIIRGLADYTFEMFETCRFRRKRFWLPCDVIP